MKNNRISIAFYWALLILFVRSAQGQVIMKQNPTSLIRVLVPTNENSNTAGSVNALSEMLVYLPNCEPPCNQNFDTYGTSMTKRSPRSNLQGGNSSAFKKDNELNFDIELQPVGAPPAKGVNYKAYRIFVENNQVCVGYRAVPGRKAQLIARNIKAIRTNSTTYTISWYVGEEIATVIFAKKKGFVIC